MSECTLFSTIKLALHIFWGKQELLLLHVVMHFSWLRTNKHRIIVNTDSTLPTENAIKKMTKHGTICSIQEND